MLSKASFFSQLVALVAAASLVFGSPAIGIVTASGHFTLERSRVWGNSTLFDGATIETDTASSELSLQGGAKVQLAAASRARVWADRLVLEKGTGQASGASYEIDAAGFKIRPGGENTRFRVSLSDRLEVTALTGSARVTNRSGALLAAVPAGRSMAFAMQAAGGVTHAGCLLYKDGRFILQDEGTQEVVELNGRDLAANTGNRVVVTGTAASGKPSVTIATSVVNVSSTVVTSQGGCLSVASALDARTEAPASAAAAGGGTAQPAATQTPAKTGGGGGLSTGAKVAIVALVAGGGAGAALALAGKKSSTSP